MNPSIGYVVDGKSNKLTVVLTNEEVSLSIGELVIILDEKENIKYLGKVIDINLETVVPNEFLKYMAHTYKDEFEKVLFAEEIRFFKVAKVKILLVKIGDKIVSPKTIPRFFSKVVKFSKDYEEFISKFKDKIEIGRIRSGIEILDIKVSLPLPETITHHILISAATGKGKSNLAKIILSEILRNDFPICFIAFDPHKEYYGDENFKGLRDLKPFRHKLKYFTNLGQLREGEVGEDLLIPLRELEPEDFIGFMDLTEPQEQLLTIIFRLWKKGEISYEGWLEFLLEKETRDIIKELNKCGIGKFQPTTIETLKRKLIYYLDLDPNTLKGITFSKLDDEKYSFFGKIITYLEKGVSILIDTSYVKSTTERILASSIVTRVLNHYVYLRQNKVEKWKKLPYVLILIEEAPRFIGKDILSRRTNSFERVAREGRKFKVGLCAITQMPSLIPKEILSQLNTKIILGTTSPEDRRSLIESSSQDILDEDREIQMLDKGEAIITSPFISIPTPVKIYLFEDYLKKFDESEENPIDFIC